MSDPQFKPSDEKTLIIAMVLQDIKDALLQQKNTSVVTIQAEKPNIYYWARFDPRDEEMWLDEVYEDVRETPLFDIGVAEDKEKALKILRDKGVVKRLVVNSVREDSIGLGNLIEFVRSFQIELNVVKFLKYYDAYIKAAKPALDEYLALSENKPLQEEIQIAAPRQTEDFPARLSLNSATKTIRLTALGKTVDIKRFNSKASANYRAFKQLSLRANEALSKKDMGVPPNGTAVKDIPKTMGFNGKLKNIFFTTDSKKQTLILHPEKILKGSEAETIRTLMQDNSMQK